MDGFDVTPLGEIGELGAVEAQAPPGDVPLRLHAGTQRSEAYLVLEGELTFRFGNEEHRIEQETWVFVPPAAGAFAVSVTGHGSARFLVLHVPSSGQDAEPVIRRAGGAEGETVTNRPGRRATVLVETDDLIVSEFAYGPGERGAKPHVHHLHGDGFLVAEGEFAFRFRDGSHALAAGTLVLIPPNAVHGFDNDSTERARCFNFHMPSSGFGDYLRGRNPDFDQHDPPEVDSVAASVVVARLSQ